MKDHSTPTAASFILFGGEAVSVLYDLRWMLVLIVVLVLADFWFGVSDSIHKKVEFRFSRAGRRTCNKLIDYMTYLLVGTLVGLGITEPLGWVNHTATASIGLGFGCIWEIDSIVGHVCSIHGFNPKLSIRRILIAIIKQKNNDIGEAVEKALEEQPANQTSDKQNNKTA